MIWPFCEWQCESLREMSDCEIHLTIRNVSKRATTNYFVMENGGILLNYIFAKYLIHQIANRFHRRRFYDGGRARRCSARNAARSNMKSARARIESEVRLVWTISHIHIPTIIILKQLQFNFNEIFAYSYNWSNEKTAMHLHLPV